MATLTASRPEALERGRLCRKMGYLQELIDQAFGEEWYGELSVIGVPNPNAIYHLTMKQLAHEVKLTWEQSFFLTVEQYSEYLRQQ